MARVWTSGVLNTLGVSSPLSIGSRLSLNPRRPSAAGAAFEPAAGIAITPRIRLERLVNDGRTGQIWVALHLGLATKVEVTFADTSTAPESGAAEDAERFLAQAGVTAHLNEPHVVGIIEHGDVSGVPYIVTELLEGRSLRQRVLHGPAALDEAQTVVEQVCDALAKAHSRGIAHGSLRLDSIFSTDVGGLPFLKVQGFGVPIESKYAGRATAYSSPEQLLLGSGCDAASDLWAFAVSLYELLTTTLPFEAATPAGVTVAICSGDFARPSHYRADLPPAIDSWFATALAKDRALRFRDVGDFARSFLRALANETEAPAPVQAAPLSQYPGTADDGSLELDDGEADEQTVRWDLPEDWSGSLERPQAAPARGRSVAPSARPGGLAAASVSGVATALPAGGAPLSVPPPALGASDPASPARVSVAAPGRASRSLSELAAPSTVPPTLQPSAYLESPYLASVASALAVPEGALMERAAPQGLFAGLRLSAGGFSADKTWLAAAAFVAGVAVTWLSYDPEPSSSESAADTASVGADDQTVIRTLSVDDLPRVEGEEAELPVIVRTSALPPLTDEVADPAAAAAAARPVAVSAPVQRIQALAPSPPRAHAPTPARAHAASPARAHAPSAPRAHAPSAASAAKTPASKADTRSSCNPPYSVDARGIQRLKPECLNAAAPVVAGPYGAVLTTHAAAKTSAAAPAKASAAAPTKAASGSGKQARASGNCSPPYYFEGNIRRIKPDCL